MVSRSTRPAASAPTRPLLETPGLPPGRAQVVLPAWPAVRGDLRPSTASTQPGAVIPDPCASVSTPFRIVGPTPHAAPDTVAKVGSCSPQPTSKVVCADDARCICPLSGHITDVEREIMNDVCGQAAHVATALRWALALAALVVLIMLMR